MLSLPACGGPVLLSRDVEQGADWFVRLDSLQTTEQTTGHYDHPYSWQVDDLSLILTRLFLEERVGLMDNAKPAKPVLSPEEIALIRLAIRRAFQEAAPREWIAFLLLSPNAGERSLTSGAFFLEAQKLHVVVANNHTAVARNSEEVARVRANPLYSIHGSGGVVAFEPTRFGLGTRANWSGGHRASASELILDHTAFLSYLTHATPHESTIRSPAQSIENSQVEGKRSSNSVSDQDVRQEQSMRERLQEEIKQVRQQLAEKDLEIDRLKALLDVVVEGNVGNLLLCGGESDLLFGIHPHGSDAGRLSISRQCRG